MPGAKTRKRSERRKLRVDKKASEVENVLNWRILQFRKLLQEHGMEESEAKKQALRLAMDYSGDHWSARRMLEGGCSPKRLLEILL